MKCSQSSSFLIHSVFLIIISVVNYWLLPGFLSGSLSGGSKTFMQLLSDTSRSPTAFETKTLKWSFYRVQFANPYSRSTFLFGFGALSKSVSFCVILCNLRIKTWQISRLQTFFSRYNCLRIIFYFLPHIHAGFLSEVSHKPCFLLIFRSYKYM